MNKPNSTVHPFIPNSVPETKQEMLNTIGVLTTEELFEDIPKDLLNKKRFRIPGPTSELQVRRNVTAILSKNKSQHEMPCFLGAGTWPHYVPAVCDEINSRAEFLTAYAGDTFADLGKFQAIFEFQSMIGELLGFEAVSWPMYDWATCCGESARMAARITNRYELLVPETMSPDRLSVTKNYLGDLMKIKMIGYDHRTGLLDLKDLKRTISDKTAAVYIENPSYLGFVESQGEEISKTAHDHGALSIVGVEPLSLGVLSPPSDYGADIAVGDAQPLGVHMNYGGGVVGILACRDEERFVSELPSMLCTITTTKQKDEYGFTWWTLPERLHYFTREKGKSFTGTTCTLWGITAAVYMALMGPQGITELAQATMQKSHYAMKRLSEIKGVTAPLFKSTHFEEFVVNFDRTNKSVSSINKALTKKGIQAGKDITTEFPELGKSALYCVTEIHTQEQIDKLADSLKQIVK